MYQKFSKAHESLLSKFIDSVDVKFKSSGYCEIIKPFYYGGVVRTVDVFIGIQKGNIFSGNSELPAPEGSFYFVPRGQKLNAGFGPLHTGKPYESLDFFADDKTKEEYLRKIDPSSDPGKRENVLSYVAFETILYKAIPFFPLLDLPAFVVQPEEDLAYLLREICIESKQNNLGKNALIMNYLGELIVRIFRFLESKPEYNVQVEKLNYLTDVRLIDIVKFIEENLDKDLTNASIAKIAYVSDDYVGQFFKVLTGRTLQDYIESQRLERAMHLLKTVPNSVQEVATMVGFKDAAYFSRRFKMRFDVNANMVRQGKFQES